MKREHLGGSLLAMALSAALLAGCGASAPVTAPEVESTVLKPFTLVGRYDASKINFVDIEADPKVQVWNASADAFEDAAMDEATVLGNYVQMEDTNGDEAADLLKVVKFDDGKIYWDANLAWIDGVGDEAEPPVSDEVGRAVFDAEYRVPMGQRLLEGYGLGEYSGTTDFSNLEQSTYYTDNDYFNAVSDNSLTILTHYKTYAQDTAATCAMACIETVLDWYGERSDLNEIDLMSLRGDTAVEGMGGTAPMQEIKDVFERAAELGLTSKWNIVSSFDEDPDGNSYKIDDSAWVQDQLKQGHPIIVLWNCFGGHVQTIVGYDTMGTDDVNDDVLIMMDPFDATDHTVNGYDIESYVRLRDGASLLDDDKNQRVRYLVAIPESDWTYEVATDGVSFKSDGVDPYYTAFDYENGDGPTDTLCIIKGYPTKQTAERWSSGYASAAMVMDFFGKLPAGTTDLTLARDIQGDATTQPTADQMAAVFQQQNDNGGDWVVITKKDLVDPDEMVSFLGDYMLQGSPSIDGLIPYLLEQGIPVMIGWDEFGGTWQTIVGYDDLGTPDTSADDVLILADTNDYTDHVQDGFVIDGMDRLKYGWYAEFEGDGTANFYNDFIVAFPRAGHEDVIKTLGLE